MTHAIITTASDSTLELRNPAGQFVCSGPFDFLVRIATANGWTHSIA